MKTPTLTLLASVIACGLPMPGAVLKPSDVVFMYQADRATYEAYGATVLAWGGQPTAKSRADAKGVTWFGSVGMVTEFAAYHQRFPDRYEEGLCRDLEGNPVKVPWLTDHQHQGVPYWWCCTQQPLFRQFLRERVIETVKAGADGLHIDDHLGTAGGLWLGICFCDRCVEGFRVFLAALPADERTRLGVGAVENFQYRDEVKRWLAAGGTKRKMTEHPLWAQWSIYQRRAAAAFMQELRELAAQTAGRPVPVGANAGLLWPGHLSDYRALDLFTAETDHHASGRRFSDLPLVAYRMAEAMGRPYAATASGGDWATIKEKNLPGLVCGWIALSYAGGQRLMAPHHQWCYTPEKGTHWYDGPAPKFAPLYQFVRRHADRFDGYETYADLAVVLPHRSFLKNPQRWFDLGNRLAAANVSYRWLVAGDEVVDHPLEDTDLNAGRALLVPERQEFLPADQRRIDEQFKTRRVLATVEEALAGVVPAVNVRAEGTVRALPRVKPGSAVIHLLNYGYDAGRDEVTPLSAVQVRVDLQALGLAEVRNCRWVAPEAEPAVLAIRDGSVEVPRLGLWGLLALEGPTVPPTSRPATKLRQQQADDESNWFDFNPPQATATAASAIDLRFLNENVAGEQGRIVARGGKFVHAKSGQPVRFWAVNGPPHDLQGEALKACARLLARYGVNLVRVHGAVFDGKTGEFRPERARHLVEVVEAMKVEGIYTHLSIYFPLWFKPQAGLDWLPGYDGNQHPFAALMFNEGFQRRYEDWWRGVLTAKLENGQPLLGDPALFGVEIQNEDSFFFWTFNENNLPDPQLRILEKQFGDWLAARHGSLAQAFEAWGGARLKRDHEAEGRVAFRPLYEMFTKKTPRDRDTAAFLFETQTGFYRRAIRFLRGLGFEGLVTPSNWTTASQEVFGPLEKLSYTTGDFVDRHGYFGCRNGGLFSEWSIRDGHTYVDRSGLRFEAEEPGQPRQFNHPVIDVHYNDLPSMISETTWCRPNRYRSEAPLFFAVYGALQDSDALVHFALDGARWSVKPGFWMQPWTLMAPSQVGQFPAAALIYRRGLVSAGALLADLPLGIDDLKNLEGTPLPQDAAFDELRLKDVPAGTELKPGNRLDPLIHFAGRTHVSFGESAGPARLEDLSKFVDRERQTVTSSTGELKLDYGRGVLTLDAPAAQGVSGNLEAAGEVVLGDVRIQCPLDLAQLVLVALDDQPLRTSKRILLQAMSEEKSSGFKTVPQGARQLIESVGQDPWRVRKLSGTVRLTRPDAADLKVTVLDLNGVPAKPLGHADAIELAPEGVYYLIEK